MFRHPYPCLAGGAAVRMNQRTGPAGSGSTRRLAAGPPFPVPVSIRHARGTEQLALAQAHSTFADDWDRVVHTASERRCAAPDGSGTRARLVLRFPNHPWIIVRGCRVADGLPLIEERAARRLWNPIDGSWNNFGCMHRARDGTNVNGYPDVLRRSTLGICPPPVSLIWMCAFFMRVC